MTERIVDAHQHFWDIEQFDYFWLKPSAGILYRTYRPPELRQAMDGAGVAYSVHVQANHRLEENEWIIRLSEEFPWIVGIVGWVDPRDPQMPAILDGLMQRSRKFRGVRYLFHEERDNRWILRPDVQPGLRALAERGLTFDLVSLPHHLPYLPDVIGQHPGLRFVVDHLAKPPIASGQLDAWARDLAAVAAFPNVYAKVSGLITEAKRGAWQPADLKPAIQTAVNLFGFDRLMFGSDWPVSLQASSYKQIVDATRSALGNISDTQRTQFWSGNAIRFYGLSV